MNVVATARLHGGPLDGHREAILIPAPEAITVAWCPACGRRHAHPVTDQTWPQDTPVYLLDRDGSAGLLVRYRWADSDDALQRLLDDERARVLAAA